MPSTTQVGIRPVARMPARHGLFFLVLAASQAVFATAQILPPEHSVKALKRLSLEELMDLEVTSVSKRPEKLRETPSSIQVVTGNDIHRSGATSIPEALRLAGNLQVAQKGAHDWGISARGFNTALANKLLVMIDGRTVYTPLFSGVFWDVQDTLLEDVDRIEVISGPGGTLWGANAVNGVINLTTKSVKDTQGLYLEAGGGTELLDFAAMRYGLTVKPNVYLRVYGKTFDRDNTLLPSGAEASDRWTMHRGGFRLDADLSTECSVTLQGDVYQGTEYIITSGLQKVSGGNLLGRWSRTTSLDSDMSLQVYYDRTHLVDPITNQFGTNQNLTDDLDTYDLDFQHRFPAGERHALMYGFGYRFTHDVVQNAMNTAFLPARADHQLFSAFAQDEITVIKNLFLTLGTKLEHNDYTGWEAEPGVRLRLAVTPRHTLWAAVSRAVRMPSRYDRDIFQPRPPPLIASGNKNFISETLIAYELGYRAQFTDDFSLSASVFYNDYDHLRSFGPTPGTTRPVFFANNLEGETHGLELNMQYQVREGWRLRFSYNRLLEHLRVKPGSIDVFGGKNETSDPGNQASLGSSWDLPRNVSLDTHLRWVDTLPTTSGVVPSYLELDVRLAWQPTDRLEFSVVGQNLLHGHHAEFGVATPRRAEIQRSVYGRSTWRF
ncbi:MAG TPA: TonB-dependent receptor [Lacunisphaera sp.]